MLSLKNKANGRVTLKPRLERLRLLQEQEAISRKGKRLKQILQWIKWASEPIEMVRMTAPGKKPLRVHEWEARSMSPYWWS